MASSGSSGYKKRKRDSSDSGSELHNMKKSAWDVSEKAVKRKEQVHYMSSSDEESWFKSPPSKSKSIKKEHNESNTVTLTNRHSGQLNGNISSLGEPKQSKKPKKQHIEHNPSLLSSEASSVEETPNSDEDGNGNSCTLKSRKFVESGAVIKSEEKVFQERNFTHKDEKEILKFLPLLDEDLLTKYNFWVLQCPNNMDCNSLVGQKLDLSGGDSCELEVDDTLFEAYSYKDSFERSATLAVPSSQNQFSLRRIPLKGNIIIEESVAIKNNTNFRIPEPDQCVELPQNLKIRHPLLGLNYGNQPKTTIPREVSKKKKKHSKSFNQILDSGLDSDPCNSIIQDSPKKKKKKHSTIYGDFVNNDACSTSEQERPKKRKHCSSYEYSTDSEPRHQTEDDMHGEAKRKKHKKKKKE